ncbi:hypothetical protein DCM91_17335 [Chitinophaga costaii]|nr:hypothetical protein DCM91_17335 [Chitinophaga costaii]
MYIFLPFVFNYCRYKFKRKAANTGILIPRQHLIPLTHGTLGVYRYRTFNNFNSRGCVYLFR